MYLWDNPKIPKLWVVAWLPQRLKSLFFKFFSSLQVSFGWKKWILAYETNYSFLLVLAYSGPSTRRTPRIKWVDSWEKNDCDEFFWDWLLGEIKVIFPLHTLLIEQHVVNIYRREEKKRKRNRNTSCQFTFEGRSFKKCDVAVKPKNNVFIWFTFSWF